MSGNVVSLRQSEVGEIDIRAFRNGDEHGIVQVLGRSVPEERALDHWRWKLRHWPSEVPNVWLAAVDGTAIFHYAGIPLRFRIDGASATVMISVDAVTSPEYRRRGLLTRGAERAFAEWAAHGVAFTLGLPNERWGSRIAATGWQALFPLQWLVRPLRLERLAARRLGIPWLGSVSVFSKMWRRWFEHRPRRDEGIEICETQSADRGFDRLWDQCSLNAKFSTVRDSAWVEWRFMSCPRRRYRVMLARRGDELVGYYASYCNTTREKTSAFIAELISVDDESGILESLVADAIVRAEAAGADHIATLAVPGTPVYCLLRRAGFLRGPAFTVYMVPFAEKLPMEQLRDPRNWHLSGADFDVV